MYNPEYVLESEMHKILRDFEIQMDNLISDTQPDLVIVNKKKRETYTDFGFKNSPPYTTDLLDKPLNLPRRIERID